MDILKKLKELNLPFGEYVVVDSGALAARGLREANDVDIVVTRKLFSVLRASGKYQEVEKHGMVFLQSSDVEIIPQLDWDDYLTTVEEAIKTADIINGFPFLNISETIKFKTALGREKDFKDIEILQKFLSENAGRS